jgi:hypothetical protein
VVSAMEESGERGQVIKGLICHTVLINKYKYSIFVPGSCHITAETKPLESRVISILFFFFFLTVLGG